MAERYQHIVFLQGDEAAEVLDGVFDQEGIERTAEYLTQYAGDGAAEISDSPSAGRGDGAARVGDYLLTWNLRRGYIGLERVVVPPCPGCVGRGAGAVCCVCGGQVPAALRRRPGDPSEVRADCPDCAAGRGHVHVRPARDGGVR